MEKDAAGTQPREKAIFDTNMYRLKPGTDALDAEFVGNACWVNNKQVIQYSIH